MRDVQTIEDFRKRHFYMEKVAGIDKPHAVLKDSRPIEVYYEDIINDGHKSWFWLFNQGEFVSNPITFPCDISFEDKRQIGMDMINELLATSDFVDLDIELQGKVPCADFREKYVTCEECPDYKYGKGESKEDSCMGAMYSIPTHMNWWQKTEEKWNKVYGEKTQKHKEYVARKMVGHMNSFMHVCGEDINLIKEVLDYGKTHSANRHSKLFK